MLVMAMVMGMSMTTFAAPGVDEGSFTKTYTVTGGETVPAETLAFSIEGNGTGNPLLVVGNNNTFAVNGTATTYTIPFNVTLNNAKAGIYTYTISEVAGATQGVTYGSEKISVSVLVELKDGVTPVIAKIGVTKVNDVKASEIVNKYDLGSLTVSKEVTGNLGDKEKTFDMTVTFTSDKEVLSIIAKDGQDLALTWTKAGNNWTATDRISLAHGDDVAYTNIPAGVTYEVVEADYTAGDANSENGYDAAAYAYSDNDKEIAQSDEDTVVVTNNKETDIATGLVINNLPYILALAAVALAAVAFMRRRRSF